MTTDAWGNRFEYVSESIASSMTEMADEIRTLRAEIAKAEAEYAELMTKDQHNRAHGMHVQAENADLRARLAEVEATIEACGCNSEAGWEADAEFKRMEAALARVLAIPEAETVAPNVWVSGYNTALRNVRAALAGDRPAVLRTRQISREELWGILGLPEGEGDRAEPDEACDSEDDWCFTHNRKHFRCYTGRPQDEEAAQVCCYDGLRPCEYPQCSGNQEAAEACPHDREPDNCCQGYDSDCEGPRRAARPAEAWSDLCAGCKGYENEPDCGTCWGCLQDIDGRATARTDTEEDHDAR